MLTSIAAYRVLRKAHISRISFLKSRRMTVLTDLAAYVGNISSSVFIIFVNKRLMGSKGYGFGYGKDS